MKVRDVLKMLDKDGWAIVATRGSHRQLKHPTKAGRVTVAGHPSDESRSRDVEQHSEAGGSEMKYFVIYEKTGTGFSAYAPDLPGCVATGSTLEDTKAKMHEAIEFHLDGMCEDGTPIPLPATVAAEEMAV